MKLLQTLVGTILILTAVATATIYIELSENEVFQTKNLFYLVFGAAFSYFLLGIGTIFPKIVKNKIFLIGLFIALGSFIFFTIKEVVIPMAIRLN